MQTQDLEEAVKARHAVLDANVRSRDYVNRAKILGVPETEENEEEGAGGGQEADGDAPQTSASMHVGMHMIGALVPSFRDQVERALEQARKGVCTKTNQLIFLTIFWDSMCFWATLRSFAY